MKYINVNLNNKNFCLLLRHHIDNNIPLSLSRIGDGELKIYRDDAPPWYKKRICNNWLGGEAKDYEKAIIVLRNTIKTALRDADILGFMDTTNNVSRAIRRQGVKPWALQKTWLLTTEEFEQVGRKKELKVCDHQVVRSEGVGDLHNLKQILRGKDLHIVSSRSAQLQKNNIDSRLGSRVIYTQVPYSSTLYDKDSILKKIDTIKETVIIIALGNIGKDIPPYLSSQNKICLDFGATVDAWAGLKTRPWFKRNGLQHHCLVT